MPSTAVAARKRSWERIKHRYSKKDASTYAKRRAQAAAKERQIALNKARSKQR
jgi:hypothetical protein